VPKINSDILGRFAQGFETVFSWTDVLSKAIVVTHRRFIAIGEDSNRKVFLEIPWAFLKKQNPL
jgi:hypothetical protein